ncbi:MAG: MATE family efflux transporter [Myxococcales bacterium]|nr:MATE family efflux transporter [Myxococcales bacterium]MCB9531847.1 MATE family efflux transporter [Myxococcales bacterium]
MTPRDLTRELRALALAAAPLVVARAGHNILYVVDTIVAGRVSSTAVAAIGLAGAAHIFVFIAAYGLMLGLDPLVSNAVGAGDERRWRAGLVAARRLGVQVAIPTAAAIGLAPWVLELMGQPPEVVALLRLYMPIIGLAAIPALLFHVDSTFLTAHGQTRQFMVIVIAANVVNGVLDVWLAGGGLGVPALGVVGIGAATLSCSLTEFLLLRAMMRFSPRLHALSSGAAPAEDDVRGARVAIIRTGAPVGAQYMLEASGFSATAVLVGLKGELALAGHQIAINFAATTFVVATAIGSAAGVRVGHARGRRDLPGLRLAGTAGFVGGLISGVTAGAAAWLLRDGIAAVYTDDPATAGVAAGFLAVAALWQIGDATQAVGFAVLRGIDDTRVPPLFNVAGYWLVGIPAGVLGAFVLGDDPRALWWGLTLALSLISAALVTRFRMKSRTEACLAPVADSAG